MLRKVWSSLNPTSLSFQILSDLHLEVTQQYSSYEIPACAEHLILAGDIGRLTDYEDYRNFLQKLTDRFKSVFLVLGNHEFYYETFETGIERAKRLEQDPALNGRLIESADIVQSKVKDFQRIADWSVDDHNARHDSDYSWLMKEIRAIQQENEAAGKRSRQRSILVMTHHAPSLQGTSSPKHAQSPWNVAFGTDILSGIPDGVKVWVFGHTHYTTDFMEMGVRVVSNQRGYMLPWSDSKEDSGFDVRKVIQL
ncbi:calcineurin-like phosphoesterase [Aspergillus piperis CBS 112811]|uniref:Calcineurin-like phosphoesterase n=1 Tax=Aspergillus piperis CBS 112811 TaxID=1448313 RepID=A0A8G1VN14_9EURO|nr:calcineurin-like phosphoesterase [Aspergillus piperis CBS 112811]RAH56258.1 calcineurin-like phosphoesterase [Aspergillus piperis CBS 112811]